MVSLPTSRTLYLLMALLIFSSRWGCSATTPVESGEAPSGGSADEVEVDANGVLVDDFVWPGGIAEHEVFSGKPQNGFWEKEESKSAVNTAPADPNKWTTESRFGAMRFQLNISLFQTNSQAYRDSTEKYMSRIKAEADKRSCFGWVQSVDIDGHKFKVGARNTGTARHALIVGEVRCLQGASREMHDWIFYDQNTDALQNYCKCKRIGMLVKSYKDSRIRFHFADFPILPDNYDTCFEQPTEPHSCSLLGDIDGAAWRTWTDPSTGMLWWYNIRTWKSSRQVPAYLEQRNREAMDGGPLGPWIVSPAPAVAQVAEDSYHNIVTEETVSGDSFRFMQEQLDEGKSAKEAYEAMVKADQDALAAVGAATSEAKLQN